jgi:hypothetical protein
MKFSCLLVLLIWRGALGLQDQFIGLNDIEQIEKIEKEIHNFGAKKQSIIQQFKLWQQGASSEKVKQVEDSIKNIFSRKGELSPRVLTRLMRDIGRDKNDDNFRMERTQDGFRKIKEGFNPLFEFEPELRRYQSLTSNIEKKLIYNLTFNRKVIDLVRKLNEKQIVFKQAMVILLTNIQNRRRPDFDIRKFYFKNAFRKEELYIFRRDDPNVNQLYKLYGEQKTRFLEEHELLNSNYNRLNQLLVDFYNEVLRIQIVFNELSKKQDLMDVVDDRILTGLERLLDIRRAIADIIELYRSQIVLIQNQKIVFDKIYQTSRRIQALSVDKKVHEARLNGHESLINDILQSERDRTQSELDADEAKNDELEAQSDGKEMNDNRKLGVSNEALEEEYRLREAEREKRKNAREKRQKLRDQRKKLHEQNLAQISKAIEDGTIATYKSPENYFKDKENSDKVDSYVKTITQRIDNGELSIADIEDTSISEKIVQERLSQSKSSFLAGLFPFIVSIVCFISL